MDLSKTLKKDILELALSLGVNVTPRMTKRQLINLSNAATKRDDLVLLARSLDIKVTTRMTKQHLMAICGPALSKQESSKGAFKEPAVGETTSSVQLKAKPTKEPEILLPWRYHENRLVLMPVNPSMVYGYWELTESTLVGLIEERQITAYRLVLNLYAVENGGTPFVIKTAEIAAFGEYYFRHYMAGCTVWLELGLKDQNDIQHPLLYSQKTQMPMDHVSDNSEGLFLTILCNDSGKRTLVFSGQTDNSETDDIFMTDFKPFPKLGY